MLSQIARKINFRVPLGAEVKHHLNPEAAVEAAEKEEARDHSPTRTRLKVLRIIKDVIAKPHHTPPGVGVGVGGR